MPRFNKGAANFAPSDPGQVPGIFQHLGCCLCPANRLDDARDVFWRPGLSGRLKRTPRGEVPEWLNGAVSKTVVGASPPRVRIPLSPPLPLNYILYYKYLVEFSFSWHPSRHPDTVFELDIVLCSPGSYRKKKPKTTTSAAEAVSSTSPTFSPFRRRCLGPLRCQHLLDEHLHAQSFRQCWKAMRLAFVT